MSILFVNSERSLTLRQTQESVFLLSGLSMSKLGEWIALFRLLGSNKEIEVINVRELLYGLGERKFDWFRRNL